MHTIGAGLCKPAFAKNTILPPSGAGFTTKDNSTRRVSDGHPANGPWFRGQRCFWHKLAGSAGCPILPAPVQHFQTRTGARRGLSKWTVSRATR